MKKLIVLLLIILPVSGLGGFLVWKNMQLEHDASLPQPVSTKTDASAVTVPAEAHAQPTDATDSTSTGTKSHATTAPSQNAMAAKDQLVSSAATSTAQADRSSRVYRALYVPTDHPKEQWYIGRINAPAAWDKTTGSVETTVAVIDTGFALQHDELFNRWATNSAEMGAGKETNGLDDDANGFIDDWRGWDFYANDNAPQAGSSNPNGMAASHGTSVAGLVGAAGDNGLGMASVNWRTKILPIQVLSDNGYGVSDDIASAMRYAVDQGADVINLSLGTEFSDSLVATEINYALSQGVLVVAAAGNDGCDCVLYPARYANVLAVGASDQNDQVAAFSSYGAQLDVVAPGAGTIYAPKWSASRPQNDYTSTLYGTSFAAPVVSGYAAMLKGAEATLTPAILTAAIKESADLLPSGGSKQGAGRIDVFAGLMAAAPGLSDAQPAAITAPLFRAYKAGKADEYTASLDRREELRLSGYSSEISRFAPQSN